MGRLRCAAGPRPSRVNHINPLVFVLERFENFTFYFAVFLSVLSKDSPLESMNELKNDKINN